MDLEHELRALAREIEWPPTPPLRQIETPHRDRRRPLAVVLAAAAAVVAVALAVPQSRGAIVRFLHLGAATIRFVDTLPRGKERPLASDLGPLLSRSAARALLAGPLLLPPVSPLPPLHASGEVVSLLFLVRGEPVLLSEVRTGSAALLKKLATAGTIVTAVQVGTDPGLWLSGAPHLVVFPTVSARLAGNVLLWQHGPLTLRLEGRDLGEARALELARSLGS